MQINSASSRRVRRLATLVLSVVLLLLAFGIFGGKDFLHSLREFPLWAVVAILGLFGLNLLLVSFRLWRILDHVGIALPPGVALRASIAGQVGSLFVISLFGQVVGRQIILRRFGVTPAVIASLTGYERAVVAVVGGGTCLAGVILLLGRAAVSDFVNKMSLIEVMIAAGGGLALSFCLGRSHFEAKLAAKGLSSAAAFKVLEVAAITLAGQLLMLSAFVAGALAVKPDADLLSLFAASAVISFAASIPITVSGWGVREIAAVTMLGHIGISGPPALAVSVLNGLCAAAVTLGAAMFVLGKTPAISEDIRVRAFSGMALRPFEVEKAAAWVLATITAALVFFQVHVDFQGATVNLNFADLFAILALASVAAHVATTRHPPAWRVSNVNLALVVTSALLIFGFLNGVRQIGVTQWALSARLLGCLVLLGYLCAGYLMSANAGAHGRRRLFETMIVTGAFIVVIQVLLRSLGQPDILTGLGHPQNFEGYAANRNAFAFQMLVCCALLLAYSSVQAKFHKSASLHSARRGGKGGIGVAIRTILGPTRLWLYSLLLSVTLAGLLFSASRAGLIACAVLIVVAWVTGLAERRVIAQGVIVAVLIWQLPWDGVQGPFSEEASGSASDVNRWRSIAGGLELWSTHPFWGAGLGVFIANNLDSLGHPLVIHSTPVWILAEFGLLGAGIFGWMFYLLGRYALARRTHSPERRVVAMLLLSFAIFSLAHEILYQRIFWLVLGAALAALRSGEGEGSRGLSRQIVSRRPKLLYLVTEDWYFCSHRLPLAIAARQAGYDVTVLTRVQAHGEVIKAAGLNLVPFEISRRGVNPLAEVVTIARLVAAYRRLAPDLVHHVAVKPVIYGSIAARLTRVPGVVNALAGLGWTFTSTSLLARFVRRVVEKAMPFLLNRGAVIVQNPDNARLLLALGVDKDRIRLIRGSGVDTATFRPGPEPEGAPVVLLPARMLWAKGVGEFVDAAGRVRATGIDARFVLVGEPDPGNPSTLSKEQLQEWQREHRVEWWGYRADMPEVFRQVHVVCLPSYYGEGVPMSLLEAASTGLPIVTTDIAGCREVVKDGDNGFLIPVRDGVVLADALIRLLRDSELRKRMGARGRERAVSEFDVGSVFSATLAIYQEIHVKASGVGTHELYQQGPL